MGIITVAAYQLLIYQMQQASGGNSGDGLMILAGLGLVLTVFYGLGAWGYLTSWFQTYLQLRENEVRPIGHCHWGLTTSLGLLGAMAPRSLLGHGVGAIALFSLAAYALSWGHGRSPLPPSRSQSVRSQSTSPQSSTVQNTPPPTSSSAVFSDQKIPSSWTLVGIWQLIGAIAFCLYSFVPDPAIITAWGGAIAAGVAFLLYAFPWQRLGWPRQPGGQSAFLLPSIVMLLTANETTIPSLLIVAAFYVWLAKATGQIRISYVAIGFLSWAMLWFHALQEWSQLLWVSVDVGGAILYIVEVDPALQREAAHGDLEQRSDDGTMQDLAAAGDAIASNVRAARTARYSNTKQTRHRLRTLATGLICLSSVYQSGNTPWAAVLTVMLSLLFITIGIRLKTRAYLFVGTGTFMFEVIRYTQQFMGQNSVQFWAVGILVGSGLIWIAATFEARRNQVRSTLSSWKAELTAWE